MVEIIQSIMKALSSDDDRHSELPLYVQDAEQISLISDLQNEDYISDGEYIEQFEQELAIDAYARAQHNTHRVNDVVYKCDFYKEISARIPADAYSDSDIKWRMSVDHPVAVLLFEVHRCDPEHICRDPFGDLFIYSTEEVESAIEKLIGICKNNGYEICDDPIDLQQQPQQEHITDEKETV